MTIQCDDMASADMASDRSGEFSDDDSQCSAASGKKGGIKKSWPPRASHEVIKKILKPKKPCKTCLKDPTKDLDPAFDDGKARPCCCGVRKI